jgi:xanthine dehydrogenase accessory factor
MGVVLRTQENKRIHKLNELTVVIKGAGEMATGIACRLYMANIRNIVMLEIPQPLAVRRTVAFCESIHEKQVDIEGIRGVLARDLNELSQLWDEKQIGVMVDPEWKTVNSLRPDVVIDAIMAKRNLGTRKDEAPLVVGVGPGFTAPDNVHVVVESNRGHNLGRAIYSGSAETYTGMPGLTAGFARERVLRSPHEGSVRHAGKSIGNPVKQDEIVLYVDSTPVLATIDGILRGLVSEIPVTNNEKVGDIEPRNEVSYCSTISDKARAVAGGVLEAVLHYTV